MNKLLVGINDLKTLCEQNGRTNLLMEWDYEKNGSLTPSEVYSGSSINVWWKCPEGHEWEARIAHRASGIGCPYCSGRRVLKGVNDLASRNPVLAKMWNYEKNEGLLPSEITVSSGKKVWWKCSNGHEWQCSPNSYSGNRNGTSGCPYCSGRYAIKGETDFATVYPELAKEWHISKNINLRPTDVTAHSGKKVWWKCAKGHEWEATIASRTGQMSGCPYCANKKVLVGYNDLATINPELGKEWNHDKNGDLTPQSVSFGSGKIVWWKCSKGHEWKASISTRFTGIGCPYCCGRYAIKGVDDLATTNPELLKEWNYEKNGELLPSDVKAGTNKSVWWKCEFGHEWKTSIVNRTKGTNCPFCSRSGSSMPEQGIAFYLDKVCKVEQRVKISGKEIDVYLPDYKIGIEYDGKYYHAKKSEQELQKTTLMTRNGIYLIRVKESNKNCVVGDDVIKFDGETMNSNYVWALNKLFSLLCILTNEDIFNSIQIDLDADSLKIRERFNLYRKENSFAYSYPELVTEWNNEKNGKLKPEMFFSGSSQKVWWKCSKGHEWKTSIVSRAHRETGCPYCSGNSLIVGENDLITTNPNIAAEWHPTKNGNLKPIDVMAGSNKKVWWICPHGHEWRVTVSSRTSGNNCPYCSGRYAISGETDLVTTHPNIINEWDYEKNRNMTDKNGRDISTPNAVSAGSDIKVWWKCSNDHSWQASIISRVHGGGCPYCSGKRVLIGYNDLATTNPDIASEWNYEKNGDLSPNNIVAGSNKSVWWKCAKGHEWRTTVSHRTAKTNGTRCPYCFGGIARPVLCVETGIVYPNMTEAVKATGAIKANIVHSCRDEKRTSGGYHWKYVE